MSFKREGNDRGLLHNLRRRRINELLAEEIPEDEAKLLCNGRFACLVCGHNPIFDTVNMLMVHRHGKKHAASEVEFVRKKKELRALILKRKHEQYMKDGTTNIRQSASTVSGGIILTQPYDPRVKKQKLKPYDRKLRLDLLHSDPTSASKSQDASASRSTSSPALLEEIPTKHSHQLKNIFRPAQRLQFPVQPYLRQHRTDTNGGSTSLTPSASQFQTSVSSSECCSHAAFYSMGPIQSNLASSAIVPSSVLSKNSSGTESVSLVSKQLNYSSSSYSRVASLDKERVPSESGVSVSCVTGMQQNSSLGCGAGSHLSSLNCDRLNDSAVVGWSGGDSVQCSVSHADSVVRTQGKSSAPSTAANDPPKKKLSQQYHLLQGSGWKKDWDGKWIRDEEAEFDSDEEAPDLP